MVDDRYPQSRESHFRRYAGLRAGALSALRCYNRARRGSLDGGGSFLDRVFAAVHSLTAASVRQTPAVHSHNGWSARQIRQRHLLGRGVERAEEGDEILFFRVR
jgi:hypothetical protein